MVLALIISTVMPGVMAFEEEDFESSLYEVMSEATETGEFKVLSSFDDSGVEVATDSDAEIEVEEGLEVLENYTISEREETSDETLYVKVERDEDISLQPEESVALYSVEDDKIEDVIIEDISEEEEPCEIDEELTGLALVKDSGYRHLLFDLDAVALDGMMPKNAIAEAKDVTEHYRALNEASETDAEDSSISEATLSDASATDADMASSECNIIAAYDITIMDGDSEYQPSEDRPIEVSIADSQIKAYSNLRIFHIKDNGEKEEITDFTVEDGKVSFSAYGFSVYEIAEGPEAFHPDPKQESDLSKLTSDTDEIAFCLYITRSGANEYFTSSLNSNNAFTTTKVVTAGSEWYFEKSGASYYIYTYVDGNKKYIKNLVTKDSANLASLVDSDGTLFDISETGDGRFYFKINGEGKWLQYSNGGTGIRFYTDKKNAENSKIAAIYSSSVNIPDDCYNLDGKSYGLSCYMNETYAHTLTPEEKNKTDKEKIYKGLNTIDVKLKINPLTRKNINYICEDQNIYFWTFHSVEADDYKLSTVINGEEKYLKITADGLETVDSDQEASVFKVCPGEGARKGSIRLVSGSNAVTYSTDLNGKFARASDNQADAKQWFELLSPSDLLDDDFVVYSAAKVSISDPVKVKNGSQVIVYTRVWDEASKSYIFYAIDHDGSLVPCYERGDNIMWIGSQVNTLLWDFTEYFDENTGEPNYYYELQNTYSKKFIAPQLYGNQSLSDKTIGLNIPGRRIGDFYSDIVAWDDKYYAYASLKEDIVNDTIAPAARSKADTFYFAIMNDEIDGLTTVETIDNDQYGITMKLVDFTDKKNENDHNIQDQVLGDNTVWNNHQKEAVEGLLAQTINGDSSTAYPTAVNTGRSLSELFGNAQKVNHLFLESTYNASGYFEYDSCQNFATIKGKDSGDFTVFKEIGTSDKSAKESLCHGQFLPYDDIAAGEYARVNAYNLYDALVEQLDNDDPRKYEKLHLVTDPDYYIGMELSASFQQTHSGCDAWGHDMIFEFTGDDDFWLYVDGELVIDLGGIHSALGGSVNFRTGDVIVDGNTTNLREIFTNSYIAKHPNHTPAELNTYLKKYFATDEKTGQLLNKFKDYSSHTMRIFYMERGAGASNLHMRFNLSYVTPGSVTLTKGVTDSAGNSSDDLDFDIVQYPFQIYYRKEGSDKEYLLDPKDHDVKVDYLNSVQHVEYKESYTPPGCSSTVYKNVFFLNLGKSVEINFPSDAFEYKIVECGVNSQVYSEVRVNGTKLDGDQVPDCTYRYDYTFENEDASSSWILVSDTPRVSFDNRINPDGLRSLFIEKTLKDEDGNILTEEDDPTEFSYRLYLANGEKEESTATLVNMCKYRVLSPNKEYCIWDPDAEKFVSTGKKDFNALSAEQKERATFETSMNGSISKIRAGYTVEVPNLPVGTKFMVEERASEIPLGYGLKNYTREAATYNHEDGDTTNSGRVRVSESPYMFVNNIRGWELKASKVWSDKDFTLGHDPVYFGVFNGDTLIDGTLREIVGTRTSIRYFFDELEQNADFADYKVEEVKLTGAVVDSNGVVTSYTSCDKVNDFISVGAIPKGTGVKETFEYTPSYEVGTPKYSYIESANNHSQGQVREDTVTNTRKGGVVFDLYKMGTTEPLEGGKFVLTKADGTVIGEYTSDKKGRITIMYEFDRDVDYCLKEVSAPTSYIGLPNTLTFKIDSSDNVTLSGNAAQWQSCTKASAGENLVAYIKVYNKRFDIKIRKFDSLTDSPVEGVHFALYKGVTTSTGTIRKDYFPIPGYEDKVTDADGVIEGIDSTVTPGKYYLVETQARDGFVGVVGDIEFTFDDNGLLTLDKCPPGSNVTLEKKEGTTDDVYEYIIKVPNSTVSGTANLTITKYITGNMSSVDDKFEFTINVEGDTGATPYSWTKNGVDQTTPIKSGIPFEMGHNDTVVITMPAGSIVTVSEDTKGYTPSFKFDGEEPVENSSISFPLVSDTEIVVTNTLESILPTGIWTATGLLIASGICLIIIVFTLIIRSRRLKKYSKEE